MKCANAPPAARPTEPRIDNDDPPSLAAATAFHLPNLHGPSRPLIDTCSRDEDDSAILCNLTGACGVTMPKAGVASIQPTPEFLDALRSWLRCGAPNN